MFLLILTVLSRMTVPRSIIPKIYVRDRVRGTLGDRDPLNKVPVEESQKRVEKGFPFKGPPYPT